MTAPPALSAPLTQPDQEEEVSAQRAAPPFNESALNILDMLLTASLDAERDQAERIEDLIERAVRAEADAEYAQRERQTVLDALRTAQMALSAAQEAADAQRRRADDLAARLAAAEARAARAERRGWWWWPW